MRRPFTLLFAVLLSTSSSLVAMQSQDDEEPFEEPSGAEDVDFRISGEVKAHYRWSEEDFLPLTFFPPELAPVGRDSVELRTVDPGSSFEVSKATVYMDVDFPRSITARVKLDFIDIYDRNPTSTDRNIDVDEVYLRFGSKYESLEPILGTHVYALFGKAPKFERQLFRKLESYGLVSTAFNRFNDFQLQLGGSIGTHFYFRGQVSTGNPTFFRDPNALAGDNGTELPPNPDITFNSGFPILYHAEVEDVTFDAHFEVGGGAGVRFVSEDQETGLDFLAYYYQRTLSEAAKLHGTFYEGDLDLLNGPFVSLPIEGDERKELGANLEIMAKGFGLFFQYVDEDLASLPRTGIEVELGYAFETGDMGDPNALFTFVEPVIRYSRLNNDFIAPPTYVAPSVAWDWTKIDFGFRMGITPNIDLTLEYAFHDIEARKNIGHNEFLTTLRFRFP